MGKIGYKWKDDLIQWLDSMRSGKLPQGCVSHSESIAKLGWVVSEMSIKSSEEWNLMCWLMMLHNQSWFSISFVPHYSFHLALPYTCLSLTSHISFPVTNITSFRTIKQVQKDVPTKVASNSLLDQVMIACLEDLDLSQDLGWLKLRTRLLCKPYGRWSNSSRHTVILPW